MDQLEKEFIHNAIKLVMVNKLKTENRIVLQT